MLSNKAYDVFRWAVQFLLPGLSTLYFALANIWGWPEVDKVVGTITILQTFLAVLLGVSSMKYESLYSSRVSADLAVNDIPTPTRVGNALIIKLTPKTYETLKWVATLFLPAVGSFFFALSQLWGIPNSEQIVGTISAVSIFMGVLLGVSTNQYRNGLTKIKQKDCSSN